MASDAAAVLAHPAVVALVATLRTDNAALRARLEQSRKTLENSSVPPAKGFKPNRAARRAAAAEGEPAPRRGPQPGHRGISRRRVAAAGIDTVLVCRPERCGACGHGLGAEDGVVVRRHQLVELPPVRPVVTEAQRLRVRCRHCGHHTSGAYPTGFGAHGASAPGCWARSACCMSNTMSATSAWRRCWASCMGCR
jgi:transposase